MEREGEREEGKKARRASRGAFLPSEKRSS